jgi:transcriptional regulator with XRE-family HTH domain
MTGRRPPTYLEISKAVESLPIAVAERRRALGMSVRAAAKEIGIARNTLTRFEDGEDVSIKFQIPILRWLSDGDRPTRKPRLTV